MMERGRFNSSLRREGVRQHVVRTSGYRKWPGREGWKGDGGFGGMQAGSGAGSCLGGAAGGFANLCIGSEASMSQVPWWWFRGASLRSLSHPLPGLEAPRLPGDEALGTAVT